MRQASTGRKSSINPVRVSTINREERGSIRSEVRRTYQLKGRASSQSDLSNIPRPRIRSDSSDRNSIRNSNLKPTSRTPLRLTNGLLGTPSGTTPKTSLNRIHPDLPSGLRGRSPSAERGSNLGGQKGKQKDTRPLTDKTFQSLMLSRIEGFFRELQQQTQNTILNPNGSLKPVSLKIFVAATEELLKILNFKPTLTSANYMEELPKFARRLHYPGTMAKSWLKTANTMHAWPHVLGWLSWLVDICAVKGLAAERFQKETIPFIDNEENPGIIHRSLFIALLGLYGAWNDVNEEAETKLEKNYIQSVANQIGFTEEELERAAEELEEIEKKAKEVDAHAEQVYIEYKDKFEKRETLNRELEVQMQQISEEDEYKRKMEMEILKLEADYELLCREEERQFQEYEELNQIIQQQPMTAEERDKNEQKCSEIRIYMHRFDDHLEALKKEVFALDIKFAGINERLQKAIFSYNTDIVCEVSQEMGVNIDDLLMPDSNLLDPETIDLFKQKADAMNNLKDMIIKQYDQLEVLVNKKTNELESLQEKIKIIDQEKEEWLMKTNEKKQCIKKLKTQAKEDEVKFQDQIKKLQEDIKTIQQTTPDIGSAFSEQNELMEILDARNRRKMFQEQSAERFFCRFYEILTMHHMELNKIVDKFNDS